MNNNGGIGMHITEMIQGLVCVVAMGALVLAHSMRKLEKARFYLPLAMASFIFAFGYYLELGAGSLDGAYIAQRVQYVGITTYPVFYYLFVRDFGNRPIHKHTTIGILLVISIFMGLFAWLWPSSGLIYKDLIFTMGGDQQLTIVRGPFYWLHIIYAGVLLSLSIYEAACHYLDKTKADILKQNVFGGASTVLLSSLVVFSIEGIRLQMKISSAILVVIVVIHGITQLLKRPKEWLPFARNIIIEQMSDPYVILDTDGGLLDVNERAKMFFPYLSNLAPGDFVEGMDVLPDDVFGGLMWKEIAVEHDGEIHWFRAQSTPITHEGKAICLCVVLSEITEQKQTSERLRELAIHDSLTKLLNRGTFMEWASRDYELVRRKELPAAVMMIDIDAFKKVNDTYGHQMGDEVLGWLGKLLLRQIRKTDLCARYGGEEFLLFMPVTVETDAYEFAKALLGEVRRHHFQAQKGSFKITVSAGIALSDAARHHTIEDMIADADKALYESKGNGRDRITIYTSKDASEKIS